MRKELLAALILIMVALPTCTPFVTATQVTNPPPQVQNTNTPQPVPPTQTAKTANPLPADPIRVEFKTEDNVTLVGYYYPAAFTPAPIVVLMHWAEGDQTDWVKVGMVSWLQNRGQVVEDTPDNLIFDTPYPFKPLQPDISYNVFTFDFRGFGESGFSGEWSKHMLDAHAAYQIAAAQPGVDPSKVFGIGASIGADGVVDGCENCAGAISLSPGDYLGITYSNAMTTLANRGLPMMCVAAQNDLTAYYKCKDLEMPNFSKQIYPDGGHAMKLFRQSLNLDPGIDELITGFLSDALK